MDENLIISFVCNGLYNKNNKGLKVKNLAALELEYEREQLAEVMQTEKYPEGTHWMVTLTPLKENAESLYHGGSGGMSIHDGIAKVHVIQTGEITQSS